MLDSMTMSVKVDSLFNCATTNASAKIAQTMSSTLIGLNSRELNLLCQ